MVHPADIQDRDGGVLLLSTLFGMYPFLKKLFADAGYQGPQFATAVAQILPELAVEIVKRSDQASGFVVLPMRWVVERTLAWLNRCRRLAKDFENLQSQRAGIPPPGVNPPHAAKTLQSQIDFPDGL
jgi:transposase